MTAAAAPAPPRRGRLAARTARLRARATALRTYVGTPLLTTVAGVVPPALLYVLLWQVYGVDVTWGAYVVVAVGITGTTLLIWAESLLSLDVGEPAAHPEGAPWPKVTAVIAAYLPNEAETIFGTLEAFARLEYPGEKEVVLAYNTPVDMPEVERELEWFAFSHLDVRVLRVHGSTSKAENVNEAMLHVDGDVVAVFDADHEPAPDSFTRAARWIVDSGVDVVQGRCVVRNGGETLLSRLVAVEFEQIYGVSHPGRARMHGFGLFGGTNGFWRADVLRHTTFDTTMLTEDIDSGMRALRAGHVIVSDPRLVSYELATTAMSAFWWQRMRWAQGWFQVTLRHWQPLVTSRRLTLRQRVGAAHLFLWREAYPWLALQMWPILAFWVYRYSVGGMSWTVLPWVVLTVLNLSAGPLLVLFSWHRAHPEVRSRASWFLVAMLLAPFYSELKNGICRLAQVKQVRGGQHQWVVTPRGRGGATPAAPVTPAASVGVPVAG